MGPKELVLCGLSLAKINPYCSALKSYHPAFPKERTQLSISDTKRSRFMLTVKQRMAQRAKKLLMAEQD